jgi:hypothetical protein
MSKKKNKIRQTPWSLGSIPLSEVAVKNPNAPEDRATLLARLQREEDEAKRNADPIYQAEQGLNNTLRELQRLSTIYWSRPVSELTGTFKDEGAKDLTFSVPALRDQYTKDEAGTAFDQFHEKTFKPAGYEFTESGAFRLIRFGLAQATLNGADLSNAEAWKSAFLHLKDNLKAFQPGDFVKVPLVRHVEQAPPKPTLADIEALNISGNEADARRAKEVATELMYAEGSPLHHEWLTSLYEGFNGFRPTDDDLRYIYNFAFPRNNLSYVDRRSFDFIRRHMCAIGRWDGNRLLTSDEKLCAEIDALDDRNMSFDEKQALRAKLMSQRKQNY